jgi:hypothetical protein
MIEHILGYSATAVLALLFITSFVRAILHKDD